MQDKIIERAYNNLDPKIQQYLKSDWKKDVFDFLQESGIRESDIEKIIDPIIETLLGLSRTEEFTGKIYDLGIPKEDADKIFGIINLKVFSQFGSELAVAIEKNRDLEILSEADILVDSPEYKKIYDGLPGEIKEAIESSDYGEKIKKISEKNNLQIDQLASLADQIFLVMVGMTKPNEFVNKLKVALDIDENKAREITLAVNNDIFTPIREPLKRVHNLSNNQEAVPENNTQKQGILQNKMNRMFIAERQSAPTSTERPKMSNDPYREPIE